MKKTMEIIYDKETDILELIIGKPSSCYFDEVDDDLFEAHDENTEELKGYKIMNFRKRGGARNIKIELPANVIIESSTN